MSGEVEVPKTPDWLKSLEEKRERRLKARLGHEAGAGAPCLKCEDKCPGLDLHFWRKNCKICRCSKEDHDTHDDDIYSWAQFELLGSKPNRIKTKIVLPGRKDEVELEWAPKGQKDTVDKYLKTLPPEQIPVKGSQAAQERKQALQKQIPIHDIDPLLCHELNEDEIEKMNEYIAHVKNNSVGVGQIVNLSNVIKANLHNISPQEALIIASRYSKGIPYTEIVKLHADYAKKLEKLSLNDPKNRSFLNMQPQACVKNEESLQNPTVGSKIRDLAYQNHPNSNNSNNPLLNAQFAQGLHPKQSGGYNENQAPLDYNLDDKLMQGTNFDPSKTPSQFKGYHTQGYSKTKQQKPPFDQAQGYYDDTLQNAEALSDRQVPYQVASGQDIQNKNALHSGIPNPNQKYVPSSGSLPYNQVKDQQNAVQSNAGNKFNQIPQCAQNLSGRKEKYGFENPLFKNNQQDRDEILYANVKPLKPGTEIHSRKENEDLNPISAPKNMKDLMYSTYDPSKPQDQNTTLSGDIKETYQNSNVPSDPNVIGNINTQHGSLGYIPGTNTDDISTCGSLRHPLLDKYGSVESNPAYTGEMDTSRQGQVNNLKNRFESPEVRRFDTQNDRNLSGNTALSDPNDPTMPRVTSDDSSYGRSRKQLPQMQPGRLNIPEDLMHPDQVNIGPIRDVNYPGRFDPQKDQGVSGNNALSDPTMPRMTSDDSSYGRSRKQLPQMQPGRLNIPEDLMHPDQVNIGPIRDVNYHGRFDPQKDQGVSGNNALSHPNDPTMPNVTSDDSSYGRSRKQLPQMQPGRLNIPEDLMHPDQVNIGPIRDVNYPGRFDPQKDQGVSGNNALSHPNDPTMPNVTSDDSSYGRSRKQLPQMQPGRLNIPEDLMHPDQVNIGPIRDVNYPGRFDPQKDQGVSGNNALSDPNDPTMPNVTSDDSSYGRSRKQLPQMQPGRLNIPEDFMHPDQVNIGAIHDQVVSGNNAYSDHSNPTMPRVNSDDPGYGRSRKQLPQMQPGRLNIPEDFMHPDQVNIGAIRDINYPDNEIREAMIATNPGDDFYGEDYSPDSIKEILNNIILPNCHYCKKPFEENEFAVTIDRANVLFHASCFKCAGCNQSLADNIYFYHKESNNVYCGRDYAKIKGYPRCTACDELIFTKEYCLAENATFHLKHFCCFQCDTPLAGKEYTLEEEQPYCLPCFELTKASKCSTCWNVIKPDERGCTLNGVHFHAEDDCFACIVCRKPLMGQKLLLRNKKLFCSHDCFNSVN